MNLKNLNLIQKNSIIELKKQLLKTELNSINIAIYFTSALKIAIQGMMGDMTLDDLSPFKKDTRKFISSAIWKKDSYFPKRHVVKDIASIMKIQDLFSEQDYDSIDNLRSIRNNHAHSFAEVKEFDSSSIYKYISTIIYNYSKITIDE